MIEWKEEGEIEMTTLAVGDKISFEYMDHPVFMHEYPRQVEYSRRAREYSGEVTKVRDITEDKLNNDTIAYNNNIKGDRSRYLVTIKMDDGEYQTFYHGRIFGVQKTDRKSLIKKLISLIKS